MMMINVEMLSAIILASFLATMPVMQAHSVTELMKINEIEINPPGTVSDNQWIEIYNQNTDLLNIEGWLIKSTKAGKTFSIPQGFVILPNDYLVIPFNSVMFDLENESVVLLSQDAVEADRTPMLSDNEDDDRTWQRFPNGTDRNSELDWAFRNATIGRSNGFPEVVLDFTLSMPIFVDGEGDKVEVFSVGQMAGVKAEAVNRSDGERIFTYIVKVTDGDGFTVFLSWVEGLTILPDRTVAPAVFWYAEEQGSFLVEIFAWRSLNVPEILTPSQSAPLRIAG